MSHVRLGREEGEDIQINCPACGVRGVTASTYALEQKAYILFVIPVSSNRTSWVVCGNCREHLISSSDIHELPQLSEEELERVVKPYASLSGRFFVVAGLLLCIIPVVGFVLSLLGVVMNWRTGIWRLWSRIVFGINVVTNVLFFTLVILTSAGVLR
jgi:hypothetical protein